MPHYAVSFELARNATYSSRYNSLVDQLRAAPGELQWEETTSFVLVKTPETLEAFADRLYFRTELSATTDKLLVVDHWNATAVSRGPIEYPATLGSHFRTFIKK